MTAYENKTFIAGENIKEGDLVIIKDGRAYKASPAETLPTGVSSRDAEV